MDSIQTLERDSASGEIARDASVTGDPPPPSEPPETERRWPKRVFKIVIGILLIPVILWAVLYITKGRFLKPYFERIVTRQTERETRVAGDFQLYFAPFSVKFRAEGMTIANPAWAKERYFFQSKLIDTKISTWSLIFGDKRRVKWMELANGSLALEWDAQGKRNSWTFGDPNAPPEPLEMPLIERGLIAGSRVRYTDPIMFLTADIGIDTIRGTKNNVGNDVRFSGGGTLRDRPFTVTGNLLSPNETLAGGENKLKFAARAGATALDVSGTLPGATEIEGAKLVMNARGPNIADLLAFIGVATPETRTYRITSNLTKQGDAWRFTRLRGTFGESDIAGRLTVTMPNNRLFLDADLQTRTLDIIDAGPWIGYRPATIARTDSPVRIVAGRPRVLPDAQLRIDAIRRFDAHLDYKIARVSAESFPISNIGLTLDLDNSLLKLSPLTFDMAGGHLSSDISINARRQPVFTSYDIRLSPTPMGRLLARWGVEKSGTTGTLKARIQLTGLGDSVRESLANSNGRIAVVMPQGTFWTQNIQLAELDVGTYVTKLLGDKLKKPVEINCGLIAFTVRNGVAAADPILIDTRKNVMLGRGGFSFKTEAMDLALRADGKKFSLFSGQSPVGLGGYFAQPKLDVVSPQLLTRAGAGLGLAAVASPLAGVLAFVDIGDAKSAQCGPVLAGARASAQRTKGGKPRNDVGRGTTATSESGKRASGEKKEQRKKFLGIF